MCHKEDFIGTKKFFNFQKFNFTARYINQNVARRFVLNISNLRDINFIEESYLNKINFKASCRFSDCIIDFLTDSLKEILYNIVLLSRASDSIIQAASNAMMLLNKAGFLFINKDLSRLSIPNTDLSYGIFINTNFESSNLSGVNFSHAHLYDSNFKNCNLAKVKFEEKILMSDLSVNAEILEFSPYGRLLAMVKSKSIFIYNPKTCMKIKEVMLNFPVRSLLFSDNGQYLISNDTEMIATLWETSSMLEIAKFNSVNTYSFSYCNQFLCFVCYKPGIRIIKIYNINTREMVNEIQRSNIWLNFAIFSYSGKNLVFLSGNMLTVLNLYTKKEINQVACHHQNPIIISFNRKYIAFHYGSNKLFVYSTEKLELFISISTNHYAFDLLAFSPCGKYIALTFKKTVIKIFDLESKENVFNIFSNKCCVFKSLKFSKCGKCIAAITSDKILKSWKIPLNSEAEKILIGREQIVMASFSFGCQYFAASSEEGWIFIFLTKNQKLFKKFKAHNYNILCVSWSRDILASVGRDLMIKIWDIYSGTPLKIVQISSLSNWIEFSPDGRKILYCEFPNFVNILDIDNLTTRTWSYHHKRVSMSHWSLCGNFVITSGSDKLISIWKVDTLEILIELTHHSQYEVDSISLSNCGRFLISCDLEKNAKIWYLGDLNHNLQEIKVVKEVKMKNLVSSVVWTPDGEYIILGDSEGKIWVWDFYNEKLVQTIDAHKELASSINCSNDGHLMISTSNDRTVKLWKFDRKKHIK